MDLVVVVLPGEHQPIAPSNGRGRGGRRGRRVAIAGEELGARRRRDGRGGSHGGCQPPLHLSTCGVRQSAVGGGEANRLWSATGRLPGRPADEAGPRVTAQGQV